MPQVNLHPCCCWPGTRVCNGAGIQVLVPRLRCMAQRSYPDAVGLGRAPATALAYMYWCRGMALQGAISTFMAVRPCNPRIAAIRAASADILLDSGRRTPVTIAVHRPFLASRFQVPRTRRSDWATLAAAELDSHAWTLG